MILAVAGPEWQSALATAAAALGTHIQPHRPADAVIMLATNPTAYRAVAVEERAAGAWFDTLLDLTLGDTDKPIPLLTLGPSAEQNRLIGTPTLQPPLDCADLRDGLNQAAINAARHVAPQLPEAFSDANAIRIRYQPIVRLADMRPATIEILARLQTETGPLVGPQAIIAAMVSGDHAMSLSALIVQRALKDRHENNFDRLGVIFSFNLPLDAMLHPQLMTTLRYLQTEEKIPPHHLRLELTETRPVTDLPSIASVINQLHEAGYKIALDDITPFTPNLDALLTLPFKAVKLDRSVTIGALSSHQGTASRNQDFIKKIAAQAKQQRAIIAEGIETETTKQAMQKLGATHGQGYLFARPLPAGALRPWLTHWPMIPDGK